jgi:hypothetical protein
LGEDVAGDEAGGCDEDGVGCVEWCAEGGFEWFVVVVEDEGEEEEACDEGGEVDEA